MLNGLPVANRTNCEPRREEQECDPCQLLLFMNLIWSKTAPVNYNKANQHQLLSEFIPEIGNFTSSF